MSTPHAGFVPKEKVNQLQWHSVLIINHNVIDAASPLARYNWAVLKSQVEYSYIYYLRCDQNKIPKISLFLTGSCFIFKLPYKQ